jgi:hypothetical protein
MRQIFKDATTFFLRSKISNLTVVIPAMDHLDKHLATALTGMQYSLSIRSAICIGIKTLNKYYSKTDQSELYHIVMGKCFVLPHTYPNSEIYLVLDPRYKLAYFQKLKWPNEWIDEARDITMAAFTNYSEPSGGLVSRDDDFMVRMLPV